MSELDKDFVLCDAESSALFHACRREASVGSGRTLCGRPVRNNWRDVGADVSGLVKTWRDGKPGACRACAELLSEVEANA